MTFKFHCTCGQKVSATKDMIGTRATCPRCGASVKVPKPEEPPANEAAAVAPAPVSVQKSEELPKSASSAPAPAPAEAVQEAPTPVQPDPPATPKEAGEPKKGEVAPAPLKIVPRPVGLLWTVAGVSAALVIGMTAFLVWSHWDLIPRSAGIALGAILVALPLGAMVLRQLSRLVLRFDLGFSESLPVTILAAALALLAGVPAALALTGRIAPEQAARLLPLAIGGAFLLMIAAYAWLIRNALGRPVGVARGALACLLQSASMAVFLVAVWGVARQFIVHG